MSKEAFAFVKANLASAPFHDWLKPELVEITEAGVKLRLALRPDFGRMRERVEVHGGVMAALIDIAGYAAAASKAMRTCATIDLRVDYLRSAGGTALEATATFVKLGRIITVVDVTVADDSSKAVAAGRGAYLMSNG